ncbi:hypothetical protein INR49_015391, partial [Caranx melampygus]
MSAEKIGTSSKARQRRPESPTLHMSSQELEGARRGEERRQRASFRALMTGNHGDGSSGPVLLTWLRWLRAAYSP